MNLTGLRYFVNVAKMGSISKAAAAAYISESAVSKTIKQLETELGVHLFDRQGRTIKLNNQGKLFYSYVSDSLNLLNRGVLEIQSIKKKKEEKINVLFTVGSPLISKIVLKIQKNMQNISLNIRQKNSFEKDLKQFDFIVSSRKISGFNTIPLLKEEIVLGWNNELLTKRKFIDQGKLSHFDFIGENDENELQQIVDQYLKQYNLKLNFKYQSDEPSTVRQLIQAGLGFGFIPSLTWKDFIIENNIQTAKILPTSPTRTIFLNSPYKDLTKNQRIFSNEIADILTNI